MAAVKAAVKAPSTRCRFQITQSTMHSFALRRFYIVRLGCAHALRPQCQAFARCRALLPLSRPPQSTKFQFFGHLARDNPTTANSSSKYIKEKNEPPKQEVHHPTKAEQRRSDWTIIKQLLSNVWPKNDWHTRGTVLFGFMLLISAKARTFTRYLRGSQ